MESSWLIRDGMDRERMLDMDGLRQSYRMAAAMRYQTWTAVTRGTRDAKPWAHFLQRHLTETDYLLGKAETDYRNQPRVLAIRAHNAVTYGRAQICEQELEMFQAGPAGYASYQHLFAMAGSFCHFWFMVRWVASFDRRCALPVRSLAAGVAASSLPRVVSPMQVSAPTP